MSNGERAQKLMGHAREYREVMEAALARGSWNVAVREAFEVIELCPKAVLNYLLVEHPRVHDVSGLFVSTLAARGIELEKQEAAEVRRATANLAKKRAPAFYFETDETEADAREAVGNARFVHDLCLRIVADIGGDEPEPRIPDSS